MPRLSGSAPQLQEPRTYVQCRRLRTAALGHLHTDSGRQPRQDYETSHRLSRALAGPFPALGYGAAKRSKAGSGDQQGLSGGDFPPARATCYLHSPPPDGACLAALSLPSTWHFAGSWVTRLSITWAAQEPTQLAIPWDRQLQAGDRGLPPLWFSRKTGWQRGREHCLCNSHFSPTPSSPSLGTRGGISPRH